MPGSSLVRPFLKPRSKSKQRSIMAPNVAIRNITNFPLELVLVEHFDPHETQNSFNFRNVTRSFANVTNSIGLTNNTTRKAVPELPHDAVPFETREVNIKLPPFAIVETDVNPQINKPEERLRLTIQNEQGERHQMYCPVPTSETQRLTPISESPQMRLTGIYLPETSFVAVYSDSDLHAWMGKLSDDLPLGALSIPGTHNAPTCHSAPPSVRCQAVSPSEQLQNGVRFFDIRVQVPEPFNLDSDKLVLVHSVFPISLTGTKYFRGLYNEIRRFLDENPSETLVLSLKREGSGKGTDEQLSQIVQRHYATPDAEGHQWFTEPRVPTLGESRGKVVLVRRFNLDESLKSAHDNRGWGIDGSAWADNTPVSLCPSGDLRIQDFYEVLEEPSIEQKITYARDHLERSGTVLVNPDTIRATQEGVAKMPIYVNFLSASNFWKVGTWPEKIAARVNPAVVEHLCRRHMVEGDGGDCKIKEGDWSTGVVVCDWVGLDGDWDLVRCIVGMNAKLAR